MKNLVRCLILFVVCTSASSLCPVALLAQQDNQDVAELEHYTLTMDKVDRMTDAFIDLHKLEKSDPEAMKAIESKGDDKQTLATIDARLSAQPKVKAVINQHGLTVHEFVVVEFVSLQSAAASETIKPGPDRAAKAAEAHVNPANLDFIDQHRVELKAEVDKIAAVRD